jgi:4-azaleucine resistance transporter AzlC
MQAAPHPDNAVPPADRTEWSAAGFAEGARRALPLLPGTVVFAMAFGQTAQQKGLTLLEAVAMSTFVFAGLSQFVTMEVWPAPGEPWSSAVIVTVALVCGMANLRLILASAAMRPWLGTLPVWQSYGSLASLTDANWLIATRYHAQGGRDVGVFLGAGLALWVFWVIATVPGYVLGTLVPEPKVYGLDMVMPAFFVAMLVPMWKGRRQTFAWIVAGGVALAVAALAPGFWFIVAGAVAGAVAGGYLDD